MNNNYSIILTILLLFLNGATFLADASTSLVDGDDVESLDIKKIAQQLICDKKNANSGKQLISRISTIIKLSDLLNENNNELLSAQCIQENKEPLKELKTILISKNENVCSDEKISLIEEFNQKYISTVESDLTFRKENNIVELIKPIKIFFMHYTMQISVICKKNLINNLEWDLKEKLTADDYKLNDGGSLDKIMFGLGEHFSAMKQVNSYDDIVMLWNIIDGSLLAKEQGELMANALNSKSKSNSDNDNNNNNNNSNLVDYDIDEKTGEKIKIYIKSKNPKTILSLQSKCTNKFKPIYEKLILPIIRLADLGYSYTGEKFELELLELKENDLVKRWYVVTQICETIIPIKFIEDKSMNSEETVMINKEEAHELLLLSNKNNNNDATTILENKLQYEPTTNVLNFVDQLPSMNLNKCEFDKQLLESIKSNLTARERAVRRAISRFAKSALKFIKDKVGKFFFSASSSNSNKKDKEKEKEDLHDMITTTLDNVDEEKLLLSMEGGNSHHHSSINRIKHRVRVADIEAERIANENSISYRHTKSIKQIMSEWWAAIKTLAPSKPVLVLVGVSICLVLLLIILINSGVISIG